MERRFQTGNRLQTLVCHCLLCTALLPLGSAFGGKEAKLALNPAWKEPRKEWISKRWVQLKAMRQKDRGEFCTVYGTGKCGKIIQETEPYQIADAKWPEKPDNGRNMGSYIRNKHTGEVVAMIEQGFGWNWKLVTKYSLTGKNETEVFGLKGAFKAFVEQNGKGGSFTNLNGTKPVDVLGVIYNARTKEAGALPALAKLKDAKIKIKSFHVRVPQTRYQDFRSYTTYETFRLTHHPRRGWEIDSLEAHYGSSWVYTDVFKMMVEHPEKVVFATGRNKAPGDVLAGKPFSFDLLK